jgi:hypothetical protein
VVSQTTQALAGAFPGLVNLGTTDPSAGAGIQAPIASLGMRNNAGVGQLWIKTGAANAAWTLQVTP